MFRLLLSYPQALLRYRSLTTMFKMRCGIPNAYTFHKILLCVKLHVGAILYTIIFYESCKHLEFHNAF